jgi:hypothetical protein
MLAKGLPPSFAKTLARSMFDSSSERGQEDNLSSEDQTKFREVVFDTAAQAYGHLDRARFDLKHTALSLHSFLS